MLNRKFLPIVGSVISLSTVLPMCSSYSQFMNYKYLVFDFENKNQLEKYSELPVFRGYKYPLNSVDHFQDAFSGNKFIYAEDERSLCQVGYSIEFENNDTECTIVGIRCLLNQQHVSNFTQINFAIFLLPFKMNNQLTKLRIEGESPYSLALHREGDPRFDNNSISFLRRIGFYECIGVFGRPNGDWEITKEKADEYLSGLVNSKLT